MKIIHGILSMVLAILSLYLFIQAQTTLDLSFAFIVMMGAIVFILFLVIEEQRDDIEQLRRQLKETITHTQLKVEMVERMLDINKETHL